MGRADFKKMANCVARDCIASRLRKLNRVVTSIYNAELTALGITASQFNILTALANMQPTSAAQISRALHLEKSSLSRNLELMRRNGWIKSEGQARISQLRVSANGESVYTKAFPCWERAQNKCHQILKPEITENLQFAGGILPAG
jgi:DNA-binding MarR family transcriptional regulator